MDDGMTVGADSKNSFFYYQFFCVFEKMPGGGQRTHSLTRVAQAKPVRKV
jgi:hypothetical protein